MASTHIESEGAKSDLISFASIENLEECINEESDEYPNKKIKKRRIDILSLPSTRQLIAAGMYATLTQNEKCLCNLKKLWCKKLKSNPNGRSMANVDFKDCIEMSIANKQQQSEPVDPDVFSTDDLDHPIFYQQYEIREDKIILKEQFYNYRGIPKPISQKVLNYTPTERIIELAQPRRPIILTHQLACLHDESSKSNSVSICPTRYNFRHFKSNKTKPNYNRREILARPTIRHLLASGFHALKTENEKVLSNVERMLCSSLRYHVDPFMSDEQWRWFVETFVKNYRPKTPVDPDKWLIEDLDLPIYYETYDRCRRRSFQMYNFRGVPEENGPRILHYAPTKHILGLSKSCQCPSCATSRSLSSIKLKFGSEYRLSQNRRSFKKEMARQEHKIQTNNGTMKSKQIRPSISAIYPLQNKTLPPRTVPRTIQHPRVISPQMSRTNELDKSMHKLVQIRCAILHQKPLQNKMFPAHGQ